MTANNQTTQTWRCPMPDDVCADCGYRCGPIDEETMRLMKEMEAELGAPRLAHIKRDNKQ